MSRNRIERSLEQTFGNQSSGRQPLAEPEDGYILGRRIVDDTVTFKPEVLAAVRELARAKPWRGSVADRQAKFRKLHATLSKLYGKETALAFQTTAGDSGQSVYEAREDRILLKGRLSVVTYLQMFAYAIFGPRPEKAVVWSVNLFRRKFPVSWGRCRFVGHLVINDHRSEV